ncbi:MAG: hypothetical protein ACRDLB_01955 [Actinomycetota bacterium]
MRLFFGALGLAWAFGALLLAAIAIGVVEAEGVPADPPGVWLQVAAMLAVARYIYTRGR